MIPAVDCACVADVDVDTPFPLERKTFDEEGYFLSSVKEAMERTFPKLYRSEKAFADLKATGAVCVFFSSNAASGKTACAAALAPGPNDRHAKELTCRDTPRARGE